MQLPNVPECLVEAVEFAANGVTLRGKFFRPKEAPQPLAAIIVQGGLGGPAEMSFPQGPIIASFGLGVLMYDHRCSGYSDGEPRQQFDPWQQCRDLREAITYLSMRPDVDAERIGLWGISIGGANAMFVAALDARVKAVVAIVPPVSGASAKKLHSQTELAELDKQIYADRIARRNGEPAKTLTLFGSGEPGEPSMFQRQVGNEEVLRRSMSLESFRNYITISTLDFLFEMEVRAYAERIKAPLLMVLADHDSVAPVEEAREMFTRVPEPKQKVEFAGEHYEVLGKHMPEIGRTTMSFLAEQLKR
jgi:uncharacterized protein